MYRHPLQIVVIRRLLGDFTEHGGIGDRICPFRSRLFVIPCRLRRVVCHKTLERRARYPADGKPAAAHGRPQHPLEMERHRTHEPYGRVGRICGHVAQDKTLECPRYETADIAVVQTLRKERREGGQEAVCGRFAVYVFEQFRLRQPELPFEVPADMLRSHALEYVRQEGAPESRTATLVAEHITQRRGVAHYPAVLIICGVGAGSEYADYSAPVAHGGPCGTIHVAAHLHPASGQRCGNLAAQHLRPGESSPGTVEEDRLRR